VTSAKRRPKRLARFLNSFGSLFESTLIKIILSMPSATSRAVRVRKAKAKSKWLELSSMMNHYD
jgi:hypothetical protein